MFLFIKKFFNNESFRNHYLAKLFFIGIGLIFIYWSFTDNSDTIYLIISFFIGVFIIIGLFVTNPYVDEETRNKKAVENFFKLYEYFRQIIANEIRLENGDLFDTTCFYNPRHLKYDFDLIEKSFLIVSRNEYLKNKDDKDYYNRAKDVFSFFANFDSGIQDKLCSSLDRDMTKQERIDFFKSGSFEEYSEYLSKSAGKMLKKQMKFEDFVQNK